MIMQGTRRTWMTAMAFTGLAGLVACDGVAPGDVTTPDSQVPGTATVSVTSNPDGIAAYTVTISGGEVNDVQASADGFLHWESVSGLTRVVGISPGPAAGPLFSIQLRDIGRIDSYRVQVDQAADLDFDIVESAAFEVRLDQDY
jgi:hypothetical protein